MSCDTHALEEPDIEDIVRRIYRARPHPDRDSYAVPSGRRPSSRRTILVPATRLRSLRMATSRAS